jgi:hypothetical protein
MSLRRRVVVSLRAIAYIEYNHGQIFGTSWVANKILALDLKSGEFRTIARTGDAGHRTMGEAIRRPLNSSMDGW